MGDDKFVYNQGMVIIIGELDASSATIIEMRFIGREMDQILTPMGRFFGPRLARAGVKSSGSGLYWQKCIALMSEFVNKYDEAALEVLLLTIIK